MSSMTYLSLYNEIIAYLDRNDAVTLQYIPNFISQAEIRLSRELEDLGEVTYVVGNFIQGSAVIPKPGRWRRTLAMNYGTGVNSNTRNLLLNRDYDTLRLYWNNDSIQGLPMYYADYGFSNWLIAPTPNGNYPFEVAYLQLPEQLTINNQTNYFTDYLPDLLLYAALLEAVPFLKNFEIVPAWEAYYNRALMSAKNQNHSRLLTRTSNIQSGNAPAS